MTATTWFDRLTARLTEPGTAGPLAAAWTLVDQTAHWALTAAEAGDDPLVALAAHNTSVEARDLLPEPADGDDPDIPPTLADGTQLADLLEQAEHRLTTEATGADPGQALTLLSAARLLTRTAAAVRTAAGTHPQAVR